MKSGAALLLCLWTLCGAGQALAQAGASGVIERKRTVVKSGPDANAQLRARYLAGDDKALARRDRKAALARRHTPWLNDWRRRITEVLSPAGEPSRGDNPLAGVELAVLIIQEAATPGQGKASLAWLACQANKGANSNAHPAHVALRVLQIAATGEHLMRLSIRCLAAGQQRHSRLLIQTDSQGVVKAATGLAIVQPPPVPARGRGKFSVPARWPLQPAALRGNFSWLLQAPDQGWIAQVQWHPRVQRRSATLDRLPGPRSGQKRVRRTRALRAALRFDAAGRPVAGLFAGAIAMTAAEQAAASRRKDKEKPLPPNPPGAAAIAVDSVGLWEISGRGQQGPLWLQLVATPSRRPPGVDAWTGSAYAAWHWRRGGLHRVSLPLPRSQTEGLWSCLSLQPQHAIDCRFDAGGMPGARGFAPRILSITSGDGLTIAPRGRH